MKYILNKLFDGRLMMFGAALLLGSMVTSCDLTRVPTSSLPTEGSLETYDDAYDYNSGIMVHLRNRQGGSFTASQEYMSDLFNASADFGNRNGELHGWINLSASSNAFATVYQMYYSTMKNVNFTIEGYDKVKTNIEEEIKLATSDKKKQELQQQLANIDKFKGNSYFARAYYYFNLQLRFGTPYKAASAASDLSVPLTLKFDVSDHQKRATVQQVIDQIFSDLAEAEKLLANVNTSNSEISLDACKALKARIYLEMADYDKAYAAANELISSNRYPLVAATKEAHEQMWVYDNSTEDIFIMTIANPDEQPNGMGSFFGLNRADQYNAPDFYPTQGLIDMYSDKDLRKDFFFLLSPKVKNSNNFYENEIYIVQKFKGNPDYATIKDDPNYGRVPNGIHRPRVFRIAEQYLIAAEAAARSGKDATTPLNALRASRGLDPVTATGDALIKEIQNERTRELLAEGFHLWDLRRWNLPVKRLTPQKPASISALTDILAKGHYTLDIQPSDKLYQRLVWAIPQYDINVYGEENMPQNPGW